ncbi:MAG: hypothetical protein ACKVU4_02250 [Phycisphaerales bacterium]
MPRRFATIAALLATTATAGARQATFHGVGILPTYTRSSAAALSADGSTVIGSCYTGTSANFRPFRWSAGDGIQDLGLLPGGTFASALGVNADGTVIVGRCTVGGVVRAFRWTGAGGMQELPGPASATYVIATGVSADGSVVTGTAGPATGGALPFRWTAIGGAAWLPLPAGWLGAEALAMSTDGNTIVGKGPPFPPPSQPFRIVGSVAQALGSVPAGLETHAVGVSGNGSVVVGSFGTLVYLRGFKQTGSGAPQLLPAPGAFTWSAFAANHDGSVIGGALSPFPDSEAYVWSADPGNVLLAPHLAGLGVSLTGWTLREIHGVSADGRTFAGRGTHQVAPGDLREEAWIAGLGAICYPDCNKDAQLTVADFGCFQGKYVLGDLYADCNTSGTLTVADFGCFQGKYVLGCP